MVRLFVSRRGASSSGCLLSLLLLVAALYYGVNIGEVYFRYYRLLDETRYGESVSLPFFNHSFSLHPRAVQPL